LYLVAVAIPLLPLLNGCAAVHTSIAKKDLDVQTRMSDSIFLDPVGPDKQTVYVQVRNTSDKQNFDIQTPVIEAIRAKGYRVMQDPELAHYFIQAQVLNVEKASPTAAEAALTGGYGGPIAAGAAVGAATSNSWKGGLLGGVIGGATSLVADAAVKDVTFMAITDIQISEKVKEGVIIRTDSKQDLKQGIGGASKQTYSEVGDRRKYRTRFVSTANKANLKYEEASGLLTEGLTRSISGVF
jgi:predicted lipid-binding transport protein (Tim44 family)